MPITLAVRGQTAEYTANSPRLIQADEVPLRVTLPRSPLLSKVNCAWTDEPESQYKTEAQEVLDWFRHRIRDSYFDDFNSHCTLIAEALTTRGLPLKIDGPAAVRAVCDHLLDPELADEIESDAQLPKKVMESLLNLTTMQGWNDQLVEQFKSLPCIRLMTQRIKRMKQMANLKASWSPAHREEAEDALQMACEHGRETECMQQASVNYCEWADKLIDRQRKHLQTAQRNMDEFEQKLSALMADKLGPPTAITTPKPALQEMPCASDPKPNKPLLCWQTARACKGAHEHVLELQRKWAFWSQDFRPYMKADCKLNPKLAGWVDSDTQRRYSEQRPLFHEVVTKGAGNPQREEAVLAAMAKVLTIDKEMTYASLCQAVATMRADNPKDTYGKKRKRSTLEFQAMYEQLLTEHLLSSS